MAKVSQITKKACALLISRVRFEKASLTLPHNETPNSDTEVVRMVTKLYTESWIIPLLEGIRDGDTELLKVMTRGRY